jgi:hypothetical protein
VEWSFDSPLPNLCPVIPIFNQNGRQARNRKKGDTFLDVNHEMTISSKFSSYWANGFSQEDFYGNFP